MAAPASEKGSGAPIIGIDLGTTNSVVAAMVAGKVQVFADGDRRLHPSEVSFHPNGSTLVCHAARKRRLVDPRSTFFSVKRLVGQPFRSPAVQTAIARLPYRVTEGANEQVQLSARGKVLTAPAISAIVVGHVKHCAEAALQLPVRQAVITVPANFNDAQRAATKAAGQIAGLEVRRILNEPTAAALAYGVGRQLDQTVAIYDFGGGTFDITVLRIKDQIFEVLATGGDTFLGGDDLDLVLVDLLADGFLREHRYDLREDEIAHPRLVVAAEQIKCRLSDVEVVDGEIKEIVHGEGGRPIDLAFHLTREAYEAAIAGYVDRTFWACDEVLQIAGLAPSGVDDVILVGGTTRMPLVRRRVAEYFGRAPRADINPDEVVAWGAAVQGGALAPTTAPQAFNSLLLDVAPRALGIAVAGGYADTVVQRNAQLPLEQTRIFSTSADNQERVLIQICQGESRRFSENTPLGQLALDGLPRARRGEIKIEVTFQIDTDGILHARARDVATGREERATVTVRGTMSQEEIAAARAAAAAAGTAGAVTPA
ncbi:MAG: Hsp70 family protein [Deltaproteobacteria bacterium]|nr:Hsp70 family protein [Deltaproteobacteria bacterium]